MPTQVFVQLPSDVANTGKQIEHVQLNPSGFYREVIAIGNPDSDTAVAPVSATAGLKVDLGTDNDVTISGSVAVTNADITATATVSGTTADAAVTGDNSGTLSAKLRGMNKILADVWDSVNSRLKVYIQNATLAVEGTVASDSVDSGNPVKVGAQARSTDITAVASADRVNLIADLLGKLVTLPYTIPENSLSGTASSTGTSNTEIIAAQGANTRVYVTSLIISNSSDTTTEVNIKSASTTLITVPAPAGGGAVIQLPTPLRLTSNEALNFASAASVTTMRVSAVGFKGI